MGGGSAAGKSTIARRLAGQRGWRVYSTDNAMADHARRSTSAGAPLLHEFMALDMNARWVDRSPKTMLETFPWFRGEGFNLIVEDLVNLPREPRIVVEGFRLLPRLVAPFLSDAARAVWLLPTPDFRQAVFERRAESASWFLARTADPERALRNVLERDRLFTELLREDAMRLGMPVIDVGLAMTEAILVRRVTEVLDAVSRP
jgi:hypothetical protein